MSHLDKQKFDAIDKLKGLCERCAGEEEHDCPVARLIAQIRALSGIPIIVNDRLRHVMFT
ncbi:MAG: hypothetical protein AAB871_03370 [Patescibacteria group bacterium]